jgi:hypothetical protein
MDQKSNRGGEGRNTSSHSEDRRPPGKDLRELPETPSQGIRPDQRGQDQPTDKSRAQQGGKAESKAGSERGSQPSDGWKAQRDAATQQTLSPGEPAGHE